MATDVSARHHAEAALEHQAFHDALTDLPNRALLKETLHQALLAAARDRATLSLAVMDLNRFKEINDTLGHGCGDELLRQVAARLRGALRASDFVARLGGDEFAILLPGADNAAALQVIQRALADLATPFEIEDHALDVGGSVGIAVYPTHGEDADTLMRHADVAMYVAKRAGTGYAVYNAAHDQHSSARLTLMGDLRQAISDDQLEVHYQPKVELDALRALGCDTVQGYFVSRPLPAAELEKWLRDAPWALASGPVRATV